jgi:hypothetical protein
MDQFMFSWVAFFTKPIDNKTWQFSAKEVRDLRALPVLATENSHVTVPESTESSDQPEADPTNSPTNLSIQAPGENGRKSHAQRKKKGLSGVPATSHYRDMHDYPSDGSEDSIEGIPPASAFQVPNEEQLIDLDRSVFESDGLMPEQANPMLPSPTPLDASLPSALPDNCIETPPTSKPPAVTVQLTGNASDAPVDMQVWDSNTTRPPLEEAMPPPSQQLSVVTAVPSATTRTIILNPAILPDWLNKAVKVLVGLDGGELWIKLLQKFMEHEAAFGYPTGVSLPFVILCLIIRRDFIGENIPICWWCTGGGLNLAKKILSKPF